MSVNAQDASFSDPDLPKVEMYANQFDGKMSLIMRMKENEKYITRPITEMKIRFFDDTDAKWVGYNIGCKSKNDSDGLLIGNVVCVDNDTQITNYVEFDMTEEQIGMLAKGIKLITINTFPKTYRYEFFYKDKIGMKLYNKFQEIRGLY